MKQKKKNRGETPAKVNQEQKDMHTEPEAERHNKPMYLTLRLRIAQKPYMVWSPGPKALQYESLEPYKLEVSSPARHGSLSA